MGKKRAIFKTNTINTQNSLKVQSTTEKYSIKITMKLWMLTDEYSI